MFCALHVLRKEEIKVDFTVLEVGDHVQFYEPHRTFRDNDAFHTAEILSIVGDENPLVLLSRFVLSRLHRVRKIIPGVPVDDDSDASMKMRPHWHIIGNYTLTCGGTHGHATAVHLAADNAKENVQIMKQRIRKVSQNDGFCLSDVFSYK